LDLQPHVFGNWKSRRPLPARKSRVMRREGMSDTHRRLVKTLPSCVSAEWMHIDPHHLKSGIASKERAFGMKATDRWCVPLTRQEHTDLEAMGSRYELAWFLNRGINPYSLANALWMVSGDLMRMGRVLNAHKFAASSAILELKEKRIRLITPRDLKPLVDNLSHRELFDLTTHQVITHIIASQ
jgi:hypothetical protein